MERQFKRAIGQIGDEECYILRLVVDYTGRPITAYPVKNFVKSAGSTTAAGAAVVIGTARTASAKSPIELHAELLAAERAEQQMRSEKVCEPNGVAEWVIEFLFSPSCIAPDPHQLISVREVNLRSRALADELGWKNGVSLDKQTSDNIRVDVIAAWGMGYRMQ
ncbi:hypothetical protein OAJ60_04245 [Planctomycetaceae bacterium]|nr:hypothetical protein [Planctomycetaceae bacterium]